MSARLLDVNVLLAIAWPTHQHHGLAQAWFAKEAPHGWATCALTQLGFVRLSSNPAFTRQAVSPLDAIELLQELIGVGRHVFWSELPPVKVLASLPLVGHQQVNDALLVRAAELHRGSVVTFDKAMLAHDASGKRVTVLGSR